MCCKLSERVKNLTCVDLSLVKLSAFSFAIIIVKLIPSLLDISYPALIILTLLFGAKPSYSVWGKKPHPTQ